MKNELAHNTQINSPTILGSQHTGLAMTSPRQDRIYAHAQPAQDFVFDDKVADVFTDMMWIGVAAGVLLLLATPLLNRLTR